MDPKGFKGEEYTIASDSAMAYFDIGEIKDIAGFPGLKRDGVVPAGDRIFRLPYFDPKGRMTIVPVEHRELRQRTTDSPRCRRARRRFTWKLPQDLPAGPVTVTARMWYSRLVASVAEYMKVPASEYAPVKVAEHANDVHGSRLRRRPCHANACSRSRSSAPSRSWR